MGNFEDHDGPQRQVQYLRKKMMMSMTVKRERIVLIRIVGRRPGEVRQSGGTALTK